MKRDFNSQAKIGRCERFLLPTGLRKDEKKENEFKFCLIYLCISICDKEQDKTKQSVT